MIKIEHNVSLAPLTWWKIGGAAEFFVSPQSLEELKSALVWARDQDLSVTVIGGGSNILISDQGIKGLVISTRELKGVEVEQGDRLRLTALAGTNKAELTKVFLQFKLAPALFLCGLPGDVAGGVVMNAGVGEMITPREFVEIVDWVEVLRLDGHLERFKKEDLHWQYRHSQGWQPGVIARVGLSWPLSPEPDVMNKVRLATKKRLQSQPLEWPSCGSTFRNPPGGKAGALIDQAGLKGHQVGGAQISEKHANFIINRGGATAQDVLQVIKHIQKVIKEKHGIDLTPEVQLLGFNES